MSVISEGSAIEHHGERALIASKHTYTLATNFSSILIDFRHSRAGHSRKFDSASCLFVRQPTLACYRGAAASTDLRAASADFRQVMSALQQNQASLINVIQSMDTLLSRIQAGNGTLGMLATESTLYNETTTTMKQFRELMTDFQAHPRKYIKISVF